MVSDPLCFTHHIWKGPYACGLCDPRRGVGSRPQQVKHHLYNVAEEAEQQEHIQKEGHTLPAPIDL